MDQLILLGAELIESPRLDFFGAEAWMKDPEGNQFLLLVSSNGDLVKLI